MEGDRCHAAQHDEFALGKVDDAGRVVDDVEAYGHDRVDRPVGDARDQILEKKFNVHSTFCIRRKNREYPPNERRILPKRVSLPNLSLS